MFARFWKHITQMIFYIVKKLYNNNFYTKDMKLSMTSFITILFIMIIYYDY